jgi:hypothetical protein
VMAPDPRGRGDRPERHPPRLACQAQPVSEGAHRCRPGRWLRRDAVGAHVLETPRLILVSIIGRVEAFRVAPGIGSR